MRLLILHIQEPLPGQVLPLMVKEHGEDEAARRYRAIVVTTLRQLRGLADTRLRIITTPDDASEAVRFWLLPRLADRWQSSEGTFLSEGWEIDFGGTHDGYQITATGEILCPFLCARWVHTALLGVETAPHRVTGPAPGGGEYFHALTQPEHTTPAIRCLPELPVIGDENHWQEAMASPLGAALKKAWEEEA